jgi:hypothetical protein
MGMTDELNVSHYFKRLTAIDVLSQRCVPAAALRHHEGRPARGTTKPPRKSWVRI